MMQILLSSLQSQQLCGPCVNIAFDMQFKAYECIAQPNTTLHDDDCTLYQTHYDPGCADQCILGHVYPIYQGISIRSDNEHASL